MNANVALRNVALRVENLRVSFSGEHAVRGVSFSVREGEIVALAGESGSGKSLLCRALLGLPPRGACVACDALDRPPLGSMALVMQDAMTALDPSMPVGKQITEGRHSRQADPVALLERVGIDRAALRATQLPREFSGGMRQRASIAVALALRPKLIFADEPTTALDSGMRAKIMGLLDGIRKADGTAIVLVTHDLSLARDYADRALIMKEGLIVESGPISSVFAHPSDPYTQELIRCAALGDPSNHTHGKIHFHDLRMHAHNHTGAHTHAHDASEHDHGARNAASHDHGHTGEHTHAHDAGGQPTVATAATAGADAAGQPTVAAATAAGGQPTAATAATAGAAAGTGTAATGAGAGAAATATAATAANAAGQPTAAAGTGTGTGATAAAGTGTAAIVEAMRLCKSYPLGGGRANRVLENVSLAINAGEVTGLFGPSGIGKSTLARCLAGLEKPSGGSVRLRPGARIAMVFQDSSSALNPRMTVERIISEPLLLLDGRRPSRATVAALMRDAELSQELIGRLPQELSGGQRQRVAIARAIAANPDLIIADEPFSSLDATTGSRIVHLLRRLKDERALTMLLISHDLRLLTHVSDRIIRM